MFHLLRISIETEDAIWIIMYVSKLIVLITKELTYATLARCDHIFCLDCIMSWRQQDSNADLAQQHRTCPICR